MMALNLLLAATLVLSGCSAAAQNQGASTSPAEHAPVTTSTAEPAHPKPEEAPAVNRTEPSESSVSNGCANHIRAGVHTSCLFAENVRTAFFSLKESSGIAPAKVGAYSPVTNQHYTLACVLLAEKTTVECMTGNAVVSFPLNEPAPQQEKSEGTSTESSGESSGGESSGESSSGESSGEQDEVGSSSHATDSQFCSEHKCIGEFTTEPGKIAECRDGTFSHSGGISGACSDHGGVARD